MIRSIDLKRVLFSGVRPRIPPSGIRNHRDFRVAKSMHGFGKQGMQGQLRGEKFPGRPLDFARQGIEHGQPEKRERALLRKPFIRD
jgi:hypothetical protein